MIVSIVKNWDDPNLDRQTPFNSGKWKGIKFYNFYHPLADVLVVLNEFKGPLIGFHRSRILFSQEPPHHAYDYQKLAYDNFDCVVSFWEEPEIQMKNHSNIKSTGLPWHIDFSYDELTKLKYNRDLKTKKLSWITSNLNNRPGHVQRLKLVEILKNYPGFDLYGRGFNPLINKYDGLLNYNYSIAFENYACNDYWTEKISDCFLSYTVPIYAGCTNITDYFSEESMIILNPVKLQESYEIITKVINERPTNKLIEKLEESRKKVLDKYNFFNLIYEYIIEENINLRKRKFKVLKND